MTTTLHAGTTFLLSDDAGQVANGTEGLYFQDARFVSALELLIDGQALIPLSMLRPSPRESTYVATNPSLRGVTRDTLEITRRRRLTEDALNEKIDIANYGDGDASFDLQVKVDADFESIFQVKASMQTGHHQAPSDIASASAGRGWRFRYEANGKRLETEVAFSSAAVAPGDGAGGRFVVHVPRHGTWHLEVEIRLRVDGAASSSRAHPGRQREAPAEHARRLREKAPTLETDHAVLAAAYARASEDLIALRIKAAEAEGYEIAAGIPWYMTLFGRDSLIASYQSMLHDPSLARGTLRALAHLQGKREDPQTLEEPGRILHEYRSGIATSARRKVPRFPYYGTIDATPLFLIVVSEYVRATGDLELARELWDNVQRAVRWIGDHGDRDGDGFVEYAPGPGSWLHNLGWKDSDDSVRFRDGTIARPSIALVEVQGYVVDGLRRVAELARALGKPGADELDGRAERLARAIDERFWLEDRGMYAEALDGDKRRVDALTSNPGHLLWTRAVGDDRAAGIAKALLSPELFSGFGVRTMGSREGGFNPLSYHNGSVWPHDNSLIAEGLVRYGRDVELRALAEGLLAALSTYEQRRWPELYDGYDRATFPRPVAYPDANSPQAWATGAVLLLVRALLGISVDALRRTLVLHPIDVDGLSHLRLHGLRVGGAQLDLEVGFTDGAPRASVRGLPDGWTVEGASVAAAG
jgi:glycogen debranching enzyme